MLKEAEVDTPLIVPSDALSRMLWVSICMERRKMCKRERNLTCPLRLASPPGQTSASASLLPRPLLVSCPFLSPLGSLFTSWPAEIKSWGRTLIRSLFLNQWVALP